MANTYVDYVGSDGTGTDGKEFAFSFPYIKTSHVVVEINQGPAGGTNKWERTTAFTVSTSPSTRVVLDSAPNSLWKIRVLRDSDANVSLVDFANGSVLTETELDNAYLHNRYLAEEAEEGVSGGTISKNDDGQFNADGLRLENLAAPDSDDDAVNKGYADGRYVDEAGDTMTGNLDMGANKVTSSATPSSGNDLTNKTYTDATFVDAAGDTMTGNLVMGGTNPTDRNITGVNSVQGLVAPTSDDHAANKKYVDDTDADRKTYIDNAINTEATARASGDQTLTNSKVDRGGDTMSGPLVLPSVDPSDNNHATRKRYVDQQIAVAVSSGTPGGPIDTANISDGAITTDKIDDGAITTAKIEDDAVTAAKLDHTTVTAGSYTNTDITVDENGRITAASNGSSGAGATNLGQTLTNTSVEITSSTGDNTTIAGAVASGNAGVMTGADKNKLDGIDTGATANDSDANLKNRANHTGTQTAATISDFDTAVSDNTDVQANTAKVSNATHTGDVTGSTALTIANDAVTAAKISSTDTTLNVNDSNNNIGTGALADSGYQLTVDSGTGKNLIYAKGNKASGYVDVDIENENALGNGARLQLKQGSNSAVFQYQETNERVAITLVDAAVSAGLTISCPSSSQGIIAPSGTMWSNPNSNIDLGTATNQWGTIYASAVNVNGNTSFVSKWDSGWFNNSSGSPSGLQNGGTYTFSHTLGTASAQVQVWMAKSGSGLDQTLVVPNLVVTGPTQLEYGAHVQDVTTSNISVQLCADGTLEWTPTGHTTAAWGTTYTYIKVIAIG